MNKKANLLEGEIIHLVLIVFFVGGFAVIIWSQMNGASSWADYYAKETVKIINFAQPGDVITLDIHKATVVAQRNGVQNLNEVFTFDNTENEVCYKLSTARKTCYKFFNEVDIINKKMEFGVPINLLSIEIAEVKENV